jgi:predicted AAA+ superfamily ATPase
LSGHPVAGASWEGFAIENLIAAAPVRTMPSFYRTAAGGEIDLILEIPGHGRWAFDIKRSRSANPEKGFYLAVQDLKPDRQFLVNSGDERYPMRDGLEAIGLSGMAAVLGNL